MKAIQQSGGTLFNGLTTRRNDWDGVNVTRRPISLGQSIDFRNSLTLINRKRLSSGESCAAHGNINSVNSRISFSPLVINCKKSIFPLANNQLSSECGVRSSGTEEPSYVEEGDSSTSSIEEVRGGVSVSTGPSLRRFQNAKREFIMLSLPAIAGQAIDPLAQLMETAYIGGLGSLELGSAGVSMSIFNVISKLFNIPLLSVATSFVAEDISRSANVDSTSEACYQEGTSNKSLIGMAERRQLSSVSTALLLAVGIGIFEALALYCGSGFLLNLMGIPEASPMRTLAERFLSLRALGAPAVVVSLALQGVFRGFKDTKTPVLCLGIGNLLAVFLFPILMYYFQLGVSGAAMSTVVSQYVVTILMIWHLNKRAILLPPRLGDLKFGSYIKSGGFLLGRTLAVLTTMTLATSMAARQGPVAMAGHQICLQVWLAVSLLTDALAASGQALIATSLSKCDFKSAREITYFVLKIGLLAGAFLAVILGVFFGSLATLFTKDAAVLGVVKSGILFVSASQPINALAFIFDGLHYGASDFRYAAFSMMVVGAISSGFLLYAPSNFGLPGVWFGLTLFMGLRMVAGFVRLLSKSGPWWFLHKNL